MEKVKVFVTGLAGAFFSWLGILAIPVLLMIGTNILDYVTGLLASPHRGENVNSYKGIRGIIKKVCMWLLVVVGAMIDQLILYATDTVGLTIQINFLVATIVAVWIICNEIISILENMVDIGVNIPPFLLPLVKNIKKQTENRIDTDEEESEWDGK